MAPLAGKIALVAGASRGAGKGIALALGDAGATVYALGRTSKAGPPPADGAPGTVEETAEELTRRGGVGIAVQADCTDPAQVAALVERIERDHKRLDVLANAVWGMADAYPSMDAWMASFSTSFWDQPAAVWSHVMGAGPYAYFVASTNAARLMAATGGGLIVSVTDGYVEPAPGVPGDGMGHGQMLWHLSHQCINLMMKGMAAEAKRKKIAVVTLMPGFMRTERVLRAMTSEALKQRFGFAHSESTEYLGRAVAALAADRNVMAKSGAIHFVADLAREYKFTDTDGRQVPRFNPFG